MKISRAMYSERHSLLKTTAFTLAIALALPAAAQSSSQASIEVKAPWVRGTVGGQKATGAFMELKSVQGAALVGVQSPAAAIVELHEMKMDGNIMRMRPISRLDLPAGLPVELKPGGYHVMLIDLKQPIKKGDTVPIQLRIERKDKSTEMVEVRAEVRELGGDSTGARKP